MSEDSVSPSWGINLRDAEDNGHSHGTQGVWLLAFTSRDKPGRGFDITQVDSGLHSVPIGTEWPGGGHLDRANISSTYCSTWNRLLRTNLRMSGKRTKIVGGGGSR